jgi:DNA-binding GntR family transcriptional regulator
MPAGAPRRLAEPRRKTSPYERLKNAIVSGELVPGQPLVETALAEWCEVSRTPIREALTRLEHDGLVERTDRGLAVRERSPDEILDIYEARIALEATAARVAAERRTSHDLLLFGRIAERMEALVDGDVDRMVDLNGQFHRAIRKATRNEALIDLLERLDLHLLRYPATTLSSPGRWAVANKQHRALIEAIEQRDGVAAAHIATEHFSDARNIRLRLWEETAVI